MRCVVGIFFTATFAYEALTYLLWLYESRVHGGNAPSRPRLPYLTAFLADWFALCFALVASIIGALGRPDVRGDRATRPVLLVHDWGFARGAMALLAARLQREGRETCSCSHASWDADPNSAAARIAATVRELAQRSSTRRVDVIAHGDSGVLVRAAAREHGCLEVLANVVSLGAPHRGSALASFLGIKRFAHLRPGSRYLVRLAEADPVPHGVNFTSISSSFDAVVFPQELVEYTGAMNVSVNWVGHHALLTSERIYRLAKENIDVEPKTATS